MLERDDTISDVNLTSSGIDDMIKMSNLSEEAILKNLKIRYQKNAIYTNTGSILVSLNPYQELAIYSQEVVREYIGRAVGSIRPPPHIFATAESCYHDMREDSQNQSVIISGESGAGKTEATKLILQYLAARTNRHSEVEQMILESSPVLEAFGNAKTVRNDNSSRFGKFIEIHFGASGQIVGARIINYLLERSRLVSQAEGERNYHVFYQLIKGCSDSERAKWSLLPIEQYNYLNKSGCHTMPNIHDEQDFERLRMALSALDIPTETEEQMFRILSGILRLGNITFEGGEVSRVVNMGDLEMVAQLIGVQSESLNAALTTRAMAVSGQKIMLNLKPDQAIDTRDALAKALYSYMFDWIVVAINRVIHKPKQTKSFIGVLDIFGFENFKVNSFEQMCINFANEKLQNFFNVTIFKLEQEEYKAEAIPVSTVVYADNQDCIDLIEKTRPPGIISLLDEECRFPKATDLTFLGKLSTNHGKHNKFEMPKKSRTSFIIKHYAGEVAYEVAGFLDKNKDTLPEDLVRLLNNSSVDLIKTIFSVVSLDGKKSATVGTIFKNQLNELMATLGATSPHYVRCIKPNTQKQAGIFDDDMVMAQLRYAGMMETIRIRKMGYPIRFPAKEFYARYHVLMAYSGTKAVAADPISSCVAILNLTGPPGDAWQMGKSKVFLKDTQYDRLEQAKGKALRGRVIVIQSWWRMVWVRNYFRNYKAATIKVQAFIRGMIARKAYYKMREAVFLRRRKEEAIRREEAMRRAAEAEEKRLREGGSARAPEESQDPSSVLFEVNKLSDIVLETEGMESVSMSGDMRGDKVLHVNSSLQGTKMVMHYESPRVASLRRRVVAKLQQNKQHTPMHRKEEGSEEVPEIVSQADMLKYSFEEYARANFNMNKRKSAISLRRQKSFSTQQICAYSKKIDYPLHKTSSVNYVNLSLTLFRKITRFIDGEESYPVLKDVFVAGIAHPAAFRNEIYSQIMKQATFNPSKEGTLRAWEVLAACCGVFPPTDAFLPYLGTYLLEASTIPTEIGAFARYAYDKLKLLAYRVRQKENRQYPPSTLELEANKARSQLRVWFTLPSGSDAAVQIDAVSTAADVFTPLTTKAVRLNDPSEFAIYEVYPQSNLERSLAPTDFITDILAKAEKHSLDVKLYLKKKMWLDPTFLSDDPSENRLEVFQLHSYILSERLPIKEHFVVPLAAAKCIIDGAQQALASSAASVVPTLVPPTHLASKSAGEWGILIETEVAKLKRNKLDDDTSVLVEYLKCAKELPFYGLSVFRSVKLETTDLDLPDVCTVGIGIPGLFIFDSVSQQKLRLIPYWDVEEISFTVNSCTLNAKHEMAAIKFITLEGVEMVSVMEDYMFWLREDSAVARAVVDYLPRDRSLLSFHKGEIVNIITRDSTGWWKGRIGDKVGQFPKDNVEVLILKPGTTGEEYIDSPRAPSLKQRLMTGGMGGDDGGELSGNVSEPTEMKGVARMNSRAYYQQLSLSDDPADKRRTVYAPASIKRFPLAEYAAKFFNVDELAKEEKIAPKSGMTVADVLAIFSESPLKIPLHKGLDEASAKIVVEISMLIMQYMGDYPSKKAHYELMSKICQPGIDKPNIRDEIFCQLLRQTHRNTKPASQVKGLELISICCGLFNPSRALGPYLLDFLHMHTKLTSDECRDEKVARDISRLAAAGVGRLDRLRAAGVRRFAPSQIEFASIRLGNPLQVRVWTLDTATKGVLVDMAATVQDATSQLIKDFRLKPESLTKREWKLYGFIGTEQDAFKRFSGATGVLLVERENICDIMAKYELLTGSKKESLQFVFQESMSLNPQHELSDPVANHLLCHQAISLVNAGKHPVTEGEAAYLSALQYFIQVSRTVSDRGRSSLTTKNNEFMQAVRFLPPFALQMKSESEWLLAIFNEFEDLDKEMPMQVAEDLYLATVRRWKFYGSSIFFCENKQYPGTNAVGVCREGLIILRLPQKEPLAIATFKAISNWSANKNDTLGVVAGSLMNPQRLVFHTPQAGQIVQALEKTVEKLVIERRKEEENNKPNYMPGATFRSTFLTHKKPF